MNAQEVAQYLLQHPNFFEEQAGLVARLELPHPQGGQTISITEHQVRVLREKNRALENKLSEWLQFGRENDLIGKKMHRLSVAIITASTFQATLHILNSCLRDDFEIPYVVVRCWNGAENTEALPELAQVDETLRAFTETLTKPYCGSINGAEIPSCFGEASSHVRSQALIALRNKNKVVGLIALGSEDEQRYYRGMGTLYLEQLGEIASAALTRVLRQA